MNPVIGPSFLDDLRAAGITDAPISWNEEGVNFGDVPDVLTGIVTPNPLLDDDLRERIKAVIAAHDPTKPAQAPEPDTVVADQAKAALLALGLTPEQIAALVASAAGATSPEPASASASNP